MTQEQIVVLSTRDGSSMAGARCLSGAAGHPVRFGTEAELQHAEEFADADLLVLVEDPALSLARKLMREPQLDIEAWIDGWVQVGRQLLRLLRSRRGRSLFVNWDEALQSPEAFSARLRERLGADMTLRAADAEVPADVAAVALSRLALEHHRQACAIRAELDAACFPLANPGDGDEFVGRTSQTGHFRDVSQAWSAVADSQRRLLEIARKEEERVDRMHELAARLESTTGALLTTERDLNEALAARIAAADELASLELKLAFAAQEHAARELALNAARQRLDEALVERDAGRQELDKQIPQAAALQARILQVEREDARLLMQLHETQEAAEQEISSRLLAQEGLLEVSDRLTTRLAGDALTADKVLIGAARDEEPYRELDFRLAGTRFNKAPGGEFDVRLIEHRGHAGLVLFEADGERQLLSCWHESGDEGERRYMLLVPADEAGSTLLDRMPSADRRCLDDLTGLLERALLCASSQRSWLAVVRRLQAEIRERNPRFRFNAVEVQAVEGKPSTLDVAFIGAEFGVRAWSMLRVRWQPGAEHPVELLQSGDPTDMHPLHAWRRLVGLDARPHDAWVMPLASAPGRSEGFDAWRTLANGDAALLRALLDALPAAAHRAVENQLVPKEDAALLLGEAHLLLRLIPVGPAPRGWRRVAHKAWAAFRGRRSGVVRSQEAAA